MIHGIRMSAAGAAILLLLGAPTSVGAIQFSDLFVFGDSLVDAGNVNSVSPLPSPPYVNGRITNGNNLADAVNIAVEGAAATASNLGGDNYAWGGARARPGGSVPGLELQVDDFLGDVGGVADANALYMINIGGNDVRDILLTPLDPVVATAEAVGVIVTEIAELKAAGAQNILVVGVGDVGAIPEVLALGAAASAGATAVAAGFNAALVSALNSTFPGAIDYFDPIGFFNTLLADPAAFGLPAGINITDACPVTAPDWPTCADYAFIDNIHVTTQVATVWGNEIVAAIPEPGTGLLVSLGLVGLAARRRAA